jgi:hypothetical protein
MTETASNTGEDEGMSPSFCNRFLDAIHFNEEE